MCKGKKTVSSGGTCTMCHGKGYLVEDASVEVPLKQKDISNRDESYPGMGHVLTSYPENGDLIFRLRYRPKGGFTGGFQGFAAKYKKRDNNNNSNQNGLVDSSTGIKNKLNSINVIKDGITITISLQDALAGLKTKYQLSNGRIVDVNVPGPIQPGSKYPIEGIQVTFNVEIPNLKQYLKSSGHNVINDVSSICPGFGHLMQGLHDYQQPSIKNANKKAMEQIDNWKNCSIL